MEKELSEINPENHGLALVQVFKDVVGDIKKHEPDAYKKTLDDTVGKLVPVRFRNKHGEKIENVVSVYRNVLSENIIKYEGFITEVENNINQGIGAKTKAPEEKMSFRELIEQDRMRSGQPEVRPLYKVDSWVGRMIKYCVDDIVKDSPKKEIVTGMRL